MYETFAYYYDQMMDKSLYQKWFDFTVAESGGLENKKVLDLACGTGDLAGLFARNCQQVYGVDLSEEMLTIASQRLNNPKQMVTLLQGDFLALGELGLPAFDLITCYDDSFCYLDNSAELNQAFCETYKCLKPGGSLLFDLHSIYQMNEIFPGYMYNYHESDWAFMWSSFAGDVSDSVEHDLTFFVWRDELGGYEALNETHFERTYPIETVIQSLITAGFSDIETFGDFDGGKVVSDSSRWFFKAKRAEL